MQDRQQVHSFLHTIRINAITTCFTFRYWMPFSKPNWTQHTKRDCNEKKSTHNTIDRTEMKRNRNETNSMSLINCNEIQYDAMRFHGGWWNGTNFHEVSTRLNKMYSIVMKHEATCKMHYRNVTNLTRYIMQHSRFHMLYHSWAVIAFRSVTRRSINV
jgi:hypothetical protein